MANRMASAIANRMAKPMRFGWQKYAPNPNPNPNPNTQILSPAGCWSSHSDQIQSHRYLPGLAAPIGIGLGANE